MFRTGGYGPLANSSIILVTHAAHYLKLVDRILVLVEGKHEFLGNWSELFSYRPSSTAAKIYFQSLQSSIQEEMSIDSLKRQRENISNDGSISAVSNTKPNLSDDDGKIMTKEERLFGFSNFTTWVTWFTEAGGWTFTLIQVSFMFCDRAAYIGTEWWLAFWTKTSDVEESVFGFTYKPQSEGRQAQIQFVFVYVIIILVSLMFTALRSQWVVMGGSRCSHSLHRKMLNRVIHVPMSYFEVTPLGRVLNRFTYDIEVLDITLAQAMSITLISISWFVAGLTIMITILPWILVILVPVLFVYFYLQNYYRKSSVDLQRIDAVSRSPIQALVAEGLDGAATIRVFQQDHHFFSQF